MKACIVRDMRSIAQPTKGDTDKGYGQWTGEDRGNLGAPAPLGRFLRQVALDRFSVPLRTAGGRNPTAVQFAGDGGEAKGASEIRAYIHARKRNESRLMVVDPATVQAIPCLVEQNNSRNCRR